MSSLVRASRTVSGIPLQVIYQNAQELSSAFGVKGDGTTDDTTAIQDMIDAVYDAGGGSATLGIGQFLVTSPLVVKAGVELCGVGKRTEILSRLTLSTQACISFSAGICRGIVRDLVISGDMDSKTGLGIDFTNSLFNRAIEVEVWDHEIGVRFSDGITGYSAHNFLERFEVNRNHIGIQAKSSSNANTIKLGRIFWSFDGDNGGIALDIDEAVAFKVDGLAIESFDTGIKIRGKTVASIEDTYVESGNNDGLWTVTGNDDGLYRIAYTDLFNNTAPQNADFTASSHTITQIRDGLLTQLQGLGTGTTFASQDTDKITGTYGQFSTTVTAPVAGNLIQEIRGDRRGWDVKGDFSTVGNSLSAPRISVKGCHDGISQSNAVGGEPDEVVDFQSLSQVYFGAHRHHAAVGHDGLVDNGEFWQAVFTPSLDTPNYYLIGSPPPTINEKTGSGEWVTGGRSIEIVNDGSTANQGITGRVRVPSYTEYLTVNFRFQSPSSGGSDLPFFSVLSGSRAANLVDVDSRTIKGEWRVVSVTIHRDLAGENEPGEISFSAVADSSVKGGKIWLDSVWANPGRVATPHTQSGQRIVMLEKPANVWEDLGGVSDKGPIGLYLDWTGSGPGYSLSSNFSDLARPPDGAIGGIFNYSMKCHTGGALGSGDPLTFRTYFYWNVPFVENFRHDIMYVDEWYGGQIILRRTESTKSITFGTINGSGNDHDARVDVVGWLIPS